jgi:hypothetical protein
MTQIAIGLWYISSSLEWGYLEYKKEYREKIIMGK